MNSLRLFALVSLALLVTARADLTIVQKVEGSDGSHQITMKVKGDKARVEMSPQMTTIIDGKSGEIMNLIHNKKMVMRISGEKARAMAEIAKSFVQEEAPDQAPPKATGKKQTIKGYQTEEYVSDSPKFHASYWVATSYPDYQKILAQMSILQKGAFNAITKGMPDYRALPGLPLRTEVKIEGQEPIVSTIDSVRTDPLSDSEFALPAGYTEMKMPDILGGQRPTTDGTP